MTARRCVPAALLLPLLAPLTGCSTMLRQGFEEWRGARAEVMLIGAGTRPLTSYRSVQFQPAMTTVGPHICPPSLLAAYDAAARQAAIELRDVFPGGEPGLNVNSELLFFRAKGLMGSAQCLTRVRITSNGQMVTDALVVAESSAFRAGGERALTAATVHALAEHIRSGGVRR